MASTLYLGCIDCKELIWIGQYRFGESYIYTAEEETMHMLQAFLLKHQSGDELDVNPRTGDVKFLDEVEGELIRKHRLIFCSEYSLNATDYEGWTKLKPGDFSEVTCK